MPNTVLITEKRSQAVSISEAFGGRRAGDGMEINLDGKPVHVIWASGHLLSHQPPDEANPDISWTDPKTLIPIPEPKLKPSKNSSKYLGPIKSALSSASEVILCTDPDREGEGIGRNILLAAGYKGPVRRMLLSGGMDKASIKKAAASIRPGSATIAMWRAQEARALADWMWQIPTRLYTMSARKGLMGEHLGTGRAPVSVGRVQTTTLKLVVDRDLEIDHFVPRKHYRLAIDITQGASKARLKFVPDIPKELIGEPVPGIEWVETEKGQRPIFTDRAVMATVYRDIAALNGNSYPLTVTTKPRQRHAPDCYSLTDLQKACGRRFKMTAAQVLDSASKLYLEGHISYPRTEHGHLPPEMWDEAPGIMKALASIGAMEAACGQLLALIEAPGASYPRPKVYQKKDAPHFGLAPTTKVPREGSLPKALANVYQAVTERYLQAHGKAMQLSATQVQMTLPVSSFGPAKDSRFSATGTTVIDPGWTALFGDPDEKKGEAKLPKLETGEANLVGPAVDPDTTKAPPRYTEPSLLEAMLNAQRFASDSAEAKILKAAEGIGTPATRDKIIETLIERGYLQRSKSFLISTPGGRDLIAHTPEGVQSVALTAQWERELSEMAALPDADAVASRDAFIKRQRDHLEALVRDAIPAISSATPSGIHARHGASSMRPPTEKMLSYAKTLADRKGIPLPKDAVKNGDVCKAFLDEHGASTSAPPSSKQIEFAKKLAAERSISPPEGFETSYQTCKRFIESCLSDGSGASSGGTASDSRPPSEKQIDFAKKIAERRNISIPSASLKNAAMLSQWIERNK